MRLLAETKGEPWVNKGAVWHMIKRLDATFDPKDHGHASFVERVKAMDTAIDQEGRVRPYAARALSTARTHGSAHAVEPKRRALPQPVVKPPKQGLETFLRRQQAPDLVAVLLELANDHEAVQARLERMQLADRPSRSAGMATLPKDRALARRAQTTGSARRQSHAINRRAGSRPSLPTGLAGANLHSDHSALAVHRACRSSPGAC